MPELPEAETIVRGLRPAIVGRTIQATRVLHADVLRQPTRGVSDGVRGRTIQSVERRAKNIVIRLDGDRVIAVNLGMTGRLLPVAPTGPPAREATHPAVVFRFRDGATLVFDDTRRFGTVECLSSAAWSERSARMGPEPLDPSYTARDLAEALGTSRSPIRSWLLDQRRIAGVGNIYASEALHLAGIHPERQARTIGEAEAAALHAAIRHVLEAAIEAGGTTLRDYRTAEGDPGRYARRLLAYGRDGEPCTRCGTPILRVVFGGRSAFYCPSCQPRRRPRG
ncbi:MAG: bifunctional DNA-formamidopyrimidine glycosylase/DNA-(apurinic or apyrimidinic site) lyase [Longimicrobiales bacterium]